MNRDNRLWVRPPDRKTYSDFEKPLPDLGMRNGHFKLVCDFDGVRPELYDLIKDPEEATNISDKYPDKVNFLTIKLTS